MMAAQVEVNKLRRKLMILEMTLKEMLSTGRPTSILKEKLTQAEALVVELPEEKNISLEWRGKLANWYKEYSLLVSDVEGSHGALAKSHLPVPSTSKKAVPPPPPRWLPPPSNEPSPRELITELKAHITASFARLSAIESNDDLEGFKELLLLIVKWKIVISSYSGSKQHLRSKAFTLGFSKLPTDKQNKYNNKMNSREDKVNLWQLKMFVQDELRWESIRLVESVQSEIQCCSQHHSEGHDKWKCASRNVTLCTNCLKFGHYPLQCCSPLKVVQLKDIAV